MLYREGKYQNGEGSPTTNLQTIANHFFDYIVQEKRVEADEVVLHWTREQYYLANFAFRCTSYHLRLHTEFFSCRQLPLLV